MSKRYAIEIEANIERAEGSLNSTTKTFKQHHRKNLTAFLFDLKIAMLINMQKIAREMALAAGRPFKGTVWCEQTGFSPHRTFITTQ